MIVCIRHPSFDKQCIYVHENSHNHGFLAIVHLPLQLGGKRDSGSRLRTSTSSDSGKHPQPRRDCANAPFMKGRISPAELVVVQSIKK